MAGKVNAGGMKSYGAKNSNQFTNVNPAGVPNVPTPSIAKAMRGGTVRGKRKK